MNNQELAVKIRSSMDKQLKKSGVAVPVQVLLDIDVLSKPDYENWRFGRVDYLERVCKVNLNKLSYIMKEIRLYAAQHDLKPSFTFYKQWGQKSKKPVIKLRFSKSKNEQIELAYATHYILKPKDLESKT